MRDRRRCGTPTLNTKVECERAERDHAFRTLHPAPASEEKKEVPTFAKFVNEQWLSTYPASAGNRPTSIREKEIHVRRHLVPALGRIRLNDIRGQVVDRFLANLRKPRSIGKHDTRIHTLSDKSIKNIRATLRRILASAFEWEIIDQIPLLPKVKFTDKGWDFFSREEVSKLVAITRDPERSGAGCGSSASTGVYRGAVAEYLHCAARGGADPGNRCGRSMMLPLQPDYFV